MSTSQHEVREMSHKRIPEDGQRNREVKQSQPGSTPRVVVKVKMKSTLTLISKRFQKSSKDMLDMDEDNYTLPDSIPPCRHRPWIADTTSTLPTSSTELNSSLTYSPIWSHFLSFLCRFQLQLEASIHCPHRSITSLQASIHHNSTMAALCHFHSTKHHDCHQLQRPNQSLPPATAAAIFNSSTQTDLCTHQWHPNTPGASNQAVKPQ